MKELIARVTEMGGSIVINPHNFDYIGIGVTINGVRNAVVCKTADDIENGARQLLVWVNNVRDDHLIG